MYFTIYIPTLLLRNHLRPAIRLECQGLHSTGVLLHRNNATQQIICMTTEEFKDIWVTPPSSTLAWLHLLWLANLWTTQGGPYWKDCPTQWRYAPGNAQVATNAARGSFFFSLGVQALVKCWRTCIDCNGHNNEKWQSCTKFRCSKL